MLVNVLAHILALDFAYFIPFVMNNLFWIFVLAAIGVFIYGKNPIVGAVFVAIYLYATFDFVALFGWVFRKGFFWAPMLVFLCLIVFDNFFQNIKWLSPRRAAFAGTIFYLSLVFINVLL